MLKLFSVTVVTLDIAVAAFAFAASAVLLRIRRRAEQITVAEAQRAGLGRQHAAGDAFGSRCAQLEVACFRQISGHRELSAAPK